MSEKGKENLLHGEITTWLPSEYTEETNMDIICMTGFLGPIILLLINIVELWNQRVYFRGYIGFIGLNTLLNQVLKKWIKQERPKMNEMVGRHKKDGYGMPSAHAQSVMFSVIYLFLVNGSYVWLMVGLSICIVTIYQRWSTKMHTMEQLIVGSLIGAGFSIIAYQITYEWIHSLYREKSNMII